MKQAVTDFSVDAFSIGIVSAVLFHGFTMPGLFYGVANTSGWQWKCYDGLVCNGSIAMFSSYSGYTVKPYFFLN